MSYFLGKIFCGDDSFQNTFVYQSTFSTLELKEDKGTYYVIHWESKGLYASKLTPLYTAFLHNIKHSGYKVGVQFNNSVLVLEQNNYVTKILNACIVYDLDGLPKNPERNFKLKKCLFGVTNIRKNSVKSKRVYTGYGIAFDRGGSWILGNDFAWNAVIFGFVNSSSSHADNRKNDFSVLREGPTYDINGSFGAAEKKFSINFTEEKTKFCLSSPYNIGKS